MAKTPAPPRIPVIYVAGYGELPGCVLEQIKAVTPNCAPFLKPAGMVVEFCQKRIIPNLVIITNVTLDGVNAEDVIQGLIDLGIKVVVMVSRLTEPALARFGRGITLIKKPANLEPLLRAMIMELTRSVAA